jgi:hypothetical protein
MMTTWCISGIAPQFGQRGKDMLMTGQTERLPVSFFRKSSTDNHIACYILEE